MTDERIIEMYFDKNEQAIDETKKKYGKMCFSIAHRILGNREDSQECENDTYLAVWNRIPPERPSIFSAFIAKITRNLSITKLRAKMAAKRGGGEALLSLEELGDCIPEERDFEEKLEVKELAELIDRFLRSLSHDDRCIFILRYWQCDSVTHIAKRLGFGESKVKMSLMRTRSRLREFLLKEEVFV